MTLSRKTTLIILIAAITIAAIGLTRSHAQDDAEAEADESYVPAVPIQIEYIDGEVVISQVGERLFAITDQGQRDDIIEANAKLDAIAEHLGITPGQPAPPKPNINTIAENELFALAAGASVYAARSKAALIWSWIHDQGKPITTKAELRAIPGIGPDTTDKLWPLIQTQ